MEVDFGHRGLTWDAATRSRKRTWVCAGRLRHSRRAFREVVLDQKQETFSPVTCTPSSGSVAVIVASFEDPLVNRAYRELALRSGFLISPCLPRRPEHKGGVEGDIKYVKRNFLPLFREAEKERGRETRDAGELGRLADKYTTKRLGRPDAARCTSPCRVSRHTAHRRGGTARLQAARAPTHQERLGSGQDPRADPARTGYLPLRAAIGKSHAAQALGHSTGSTPVAATVPTSAGCAKSAP